MKVKVNTKSNYRNLNGQWLTVKEAIGTRVSCFVDTEEHGKVTIDFNIKEVVEINTNDNVRSSNVHPIFDEALKHFL